MPAFCAAKQLLVYTHFGALSPTMAYCLRDIYLQISHHHDMTAFYYFLVPLILKANEVYRLSVVMSLFINL